MRGLHLTVIFAVIKMDHRSELGVSERYEATAAIWVNDNALKKTLAPLKVLVGPDAYLIHDPKQGQYVHEKENAEHCPDFGSLDQLYLKECPLVFAGVVPLKVDGPSSACQKGALNNSCDDLLAGVDSGVALPEGPNGTLLAPPIFRHLTSILIIV